MSTSGLSLPGLMVCSVLEAGAVWLKQEVLRMFLLHCTYFIMAMGYMCRQESSKIPKDKIKF